MEDTKSNYGTKSKCGDKWQRKYFSTIKALCIRTKYYSKKLCLRYRVIHKYLQIYIHQ